MRPVNLQRKRTSRAPILSQKRLLTIGAALDPVISSIAGELAVEHPLVQGQVRFSHESGQRADLSSGEEAGNIINGVGCEMWDKTRLLI